MVTFILTPTDDAAPVVRDTFAQHGECLWSFGRLVTVSVSAVEATARLNDPRCFMYEGKIPDEVLATLPKMMQVLHQAHVAPSAKEPPTKPVAWDAPGRLAPGWDMEGNKSISPWPTPHDLRNLADNLDDDNQPIYGAGVEVPASVDQALFYAARRLERVEIVLDYYSKKPVDHPMVGAILAGLRRALTAPHGEE